jgi:hypothetical protein
LIPIADRPSVTNIIIKSRRINFSNFDGRISPDDSNSDTSIVNLFFTKPGNVIPFIKINITTVGDTIRQISFRYINNWNARRKENQDVRFVDVLIDGVISDYKDLKPHNEDQSKSHASWRSFSFRSASSQNFLSISSECILFGMIMRCGTIGQDKQ